MQNQIEEQIKKLDDEILVLQIRVEALNNEIAVSQEKVWKLKATRRELIETRDNDKKEKYESEEMGEWGARRGKAHILNFIR